MACQRITIVKLGGVSGDVAFQRISAWSAARETVRFKNSASYHYQWPAHMRKEADEFAEGLRTNACALPIVYFIEWIDTWSMGDVFDRWLTPPNCNPPRAMSGNHFEIYAYQLPDGGQLAAHLASAEPQQFDETNWFIAHMRAAVAAWDTLVERATLVVLRHAFDCSRCDEEVAASMQSSPEWLMRKTERLRNVMD